MGLIDILQKTLDIGGSDLFIIPGSPAMAKSRGQLVAVTEDRLLPDDTR